MEINNSAIEALKMVFVTREECQGTQAAYDDKLNKTIVSLTEIKTKLSSLERILGAIGVGVLGIALELLLGG